MVAGTSELNDSIKVTSLKDHDLLTRIDERVLQLQVDVLAIQVQLGKLELTLLGVRIAAAKAAGVHGAIAGIVSAAIIALITNWLK
jgi:hypothetical protein